jgi:hypothetical protein
VLEFGGGKQTYGVTNADDGVVYFTDTASPGVGRIDVDGTVTTYRLPSDATHVFFAPTATSGLQSGAIRAIDILMCRRLVAWRRMGPPCPGRARISRESLDPRSRCEGVALYRGAVGLAARRAASGVS